MLTFCIEFSFHLKGYYNQPLYAEYKDICMMIKKRGKIKGNLMEKVHDKKVIQLYFLSF